MKILSVVGGMHQIVAGYITKKIEMINKEELRLSTIGSFLIDSRIHADIVFITDQAFSKNLEQDKKYLYELFTKIDNTRTIVVILTNDTMKQVDIEDLIRRYTNLKLYTFDFVRIPECTYKKVFDDLFSGKRRNIFIEDKKEEIKKPEESQDKKTFFSRFIKTKKESEQQVEGTDPLIKAIENMSRGISRVVAVTGHRGSGITSTVVNVACEAAKRGLTTIIIDMDIDYRSTNMYFSNFHETTKREEEISASLIKILARPQDYMTTAFNLKDKLWLASLGYDFDDSRLIEQFYNSNKLIGLISVLRNKFNLIILDIPIDLLGKFRECLIYIDVFALCITNNIYSVLSTLRNMEVVMTDQEISLINSKSKVVVTQYNDNSTLQGEQFVPDKVSEMLCSGLNENFVYETKVAGVIPYSKNFDSQIETDVQLINTNIEYEKAYGNILLRIMEGVR